MQSVISYSATETDDRHLKKKIKRREENHLLLRKPSYNNQKSKTKAKIDSRIFFF